MRTNPNVVKPRGERLRRVDTKMAARFVRQAEPPLPLPYGKRFQLTVPVLVSPTEATNELYRRVVE